MRLFWTTCGPRAKASAKGSLHDRTATDLLVHLQEALVERTGLDPARVDDVIVGCASQVDEQGADIARTAALLAGWGDHVPASRSTASASGIDAVAHAAARLRAGDLGLAGGRRVESVSGSAVRRPRPAVDRPGHHPRGGLGAYGGGRGPQRHDRGFSRDELDHYGVETQHKAAAAWAGRRVRPLGGAGRAGEHGPGLDHDELVRGQTTLEMLAALPPAFAQLGADGQDEIALNAHPAVASIEHLHRRHLTPNGRRRSAFAAGNPRARGGGRPRTGGRIVAAATTAVNRW